VRTVHRGQLPEGRHTLEWDGRDAQGHQVADGNYLVRVVQGPRAATRQVILQR
jgi:flagellar hook assembly protein FlgD